MNNPSISNLNDWYNDVVDLNTDNVSFRKTLLHYKNEFIFIYRFLLLKRLLK